MNSTSNHTYLHDNPVFMLTVCTGGAIIAVLGFLANLLAAAILLRYNRPLSVQNRLVLHTLLCDVILTSYCIPRLVYVTYRHDDALPADDLYCRVDGFVRYVLVCQYLMGVVWISYHRYTIIIKPPTSRLRLTGWKIPAVLLGSLAFIATTLAFPTAGVWGRFEYRASPASCALAITDETNIRVYNACGYLVAFLLPFVSMVVFYGAILRAIRRQNLKMAPATAHAFTATERKRESRRRAEIYVTMMSMSLVIAYFITHLPRSLGFIFKSMDADPVFHAVAATVYYLHVLYGPLFFVFGDKNIQRKLKADLFKGRISVKRRPNNNESLVVTEVN